MNSLRKVVIPRTFNRDWLELEEGQEVSTDTYISQQDLVEWLEKEVKRHSDMWTLNSLAMSNAFTDVLIHIRGE